MVYDIAWIQKKRDEMSDYEFSCQMMNDPLPAHARLWSEECEHFVSLREAAGPGVIFVMSDPAPRGVGSISSIKEKERADASKDWWSIAVVKLKVSGQRQEKILLDGIHSQDWSRDEGYDRACDLMVRWGTPYFFEEFYGGFSEDQTEKFVARARLKGVSPYLEAHGGRLLLPRFSDSHASGAKNMRFEALCSAARRQEFLICKETVPDDFLYGDNDKIGALPQLRSWRPLTKGRNSLKWDDDGDVLSRCTDSALQAFAPRPVLVDAFADIEEEEGYGSPQRSRYCNI